MFLSKFRMKGRRLSSPPASCRSRNTGAPSQPDLQKDDLHIFITITCKHFAGAHVCDSLTNCCEQRHSNLMIVEQFMRFRPEKKVRSTCSVLLHFFRESCCSLQKSAEERRCLCCTCFTEDFSFRCHIHSAPTGQR